MSHLSNFEYRTIKLTDELLIVKSNDKPSDLFFYKKQTELPFTSKNVSGHNNQL